MRRAKRSEALRGRCGLGQVIDDDSVALPSAPITLGLFVFSIATIALGRLLGEYLVRRQFGPYPLSRN